MFMKRKPINKTNLFLFLISLCILITTGSYLYYKQEKKALYKKKSVYLKAIAEPKIDELVHWNKERIADADIISHLLYLKYSNRKDLISEFNHVSPNILREYDYDAIFISSIDGEMIYNIGSGLSAFDNLTVDKIKQAIRRDTILVTGFYYCNLEKKVHYDIVAPIKDENDKTIAAIIFRVDPNDYLFPLIQSWPTPSKTSETLLLKEQNDSVLFLNELRHMKNTAFSLKIPLSRIDVPAVQAIMGYRGIFDGTDYRGERVIAYVSPVPNSNWFMISKVDYDELLGELRFKSGAIIASALFLFLFFGIGIAYFYKERQKNIYKSLYQAQEEFRTTLYSIGDAVITTDKKGKIKQLNKIAEEMTGWVEADAKGKKIELIFNIINEESRKPVTSPYEKIIKTGKIVGLANHTLLITRQGEEIPISDSGAPIKNSKGNLIGTVLVFRDQTAERITQKLVTARIVLLEYIVGHSQEELLQKSLDIICSSSGIKTGQLYVVDSKEESIHLRACTPNNSNILWPNNKEKIDFSKLPEAMAKCIRELKPIVYKKQVSDTNGLTDNIHLYELTYPMIKSDKIVAIIHLKEKPNIFKDQDIKFIGNLTEIVWDIIERKIDQESFEEEQRILNSLINTIPDSIYFKDINSCFIRINRAMSERFELQSPEDAIGKSDADFFANNHANQTRIDEDKIIKTGASLINIEEQEDWKNGKITWVSTSKIPLRNTHGQITGIMGISRDITERKKMENELIKAKKNAEQSDKLKSAFLANMSHEIRTPLNGILGFTNIILEKDQLTVSEKMKYGSIIQKSSEGLLQVINDILDISRIESGDLQIELSACEINKTLSNLHIMFQSKISDLNKAILLTMKIGDDITIETDEKRLRQVFYNLLDNAIKFTLKGEISFGIEKIENNKISFFVYDTGIGIPEEMHEIVFDRFRQADNSLSPKSGGNGLGLSIVKYIIELLGGQIWIDPSYKNGTQFRFELPYKPAKTKAVKMKLVKKFSETGFYADNQLNILLVEDDPVNQQYVKEILKEKNCNIYIATHGKEAFNIIESGNIDIILMDIRLPGISGLEITKQIRKYNHDIYIIAQTAYAMQSDEKMAIMAGCNDYIAKPILSDLLFEKINKVLKKKYGYT